MKISVVTICYNQAPYLPACINSVAIQEGAWEHIIVDAGSTDGSRDIIEANRSHFSHIIFGRDEGPADGLQKGFARATGTHGFFINSDDFLLPGAFSVFSALVNAAPGSDVFLCGGWLVDVDANPMRRVKPTRLSLASLLEGSATMFQQGMLFSMPAYHSVGGFCSESTVCWDFELLCKFVSHGCSITRTSHRVGAFRVHSGTISDRSRADYNEKLSSEIARISRQITGRERAIRYANRVALLKRHLFNPWLLREVVECRLQRGRLRKLWLDDTQRC
jgi:glycosyltransferase involved in cell wall biosynthesis